MLLRSPRRRARKQRGASSSRCRSSPTASRGARQPQPATRARATELLRRSADGFAKLEASWEEAFSRLLLAEVLAESDGRLAQPELTAALGVFEELRSVREAERARALLAAAPAR